jgi:hypothetical protein
MQSASPTKRYQPVNSAPSNTTTIDLRERWTRIAHACTSGR